MKQKNWEKHKFSKKPEVSKQNEEVVNKEDPVDEDENDVPRWYEKVSDDKPVAEKVSEHELASLKIEAQHILDEEAKKFNLKKSSAGKGSNKAWINTVLKGGTAKDKLAANVITIQNSPLHSLSNLAALINAVNPAKKKECFIIMETLAELFIEDLLRPERKLRSFDKQPLANLNELSGGCAKGRRNRLAAWIFEDKLKDLYASFVNNINIVAKDTIDNNRIKAVSVMYKLLSSHPEQEQVLLQNLINKHGDPQQKVVSKVIYCVTQLLRIHPNMKQIVMNEIEKVLFRPNISTRTQYYCICSLSQFIFSINDTEIARNIITIYFSFFKALIKKGEIDSRLMGALLMGVRRAHPYARLDSNALQEHIDTLYKLVHLTPFNIALHALSLLQEISNESTNDRFYTALYKKLLDSQLNSSCHHAMFINLMFKALSKDSNITRVKAFIKRLLQVCLYSSTPLICGLLYMLSQLISRRRLSLFADTMQAQNDAFASFDSNEDEDEKYIDVDKQEEGQTEEMPEEGNEVVKEEEGDEEEEEKKPLRGWIHCEMNRHSFAPRSEVYYPLARNPAYSRADKTAYLELLYLSKHFHPTVSLFAEKILKQELITYTGDPLVDFTTAKFLERFVFKNPKAKVSEEDKGPDRQLAQRKYYQPSGVKSLQVTSSNYLKNDIQNIPVDELFLYKYLKIKYKDGHPDDKPSEDDDDNASVTSEEFVEMINNMYGGGKKSRTDIDFMDELEHGLKNKSKQKAKSKNDDSEEEEEEEDEDDDGDDDDDDDDEEEVEGDNDHEIDGDDDDDDDFNEDMEDDDEEVLDFDEDVEDFDGELDFDEVFRDKSKKPSTISGKKSKSKKGDDLESLFAPAEEFAEILEDAGSSKHKPGMAESLANSDNAAVKQLDWEKNRDRWLKDFNISKKRKWKNKNPKKFKKRRT